MDVHEVSRTSVRGELRRVQAHDVDAFGNVVVRDDRGFYALE